MTALRPAAKSQDRHRAAPSLDHIAKLALTPASEPQQALAKDEAGRNDPPGVLRDWTRDYFAQYEACFELQVQLCTDLKRMPVEDASVEWSQTESPYRTVATVVLPAQDSFSPARRVFAEDIMSWRPWYGLAAHRPLGSINRVRRRAYEVLGEWRHTSNAAMEVDPRTLADVPD